MPEGLGFARPEWLPALWALALVPLLYLLRRRASRLAVPHLPLWEKVLDRFRKRFTWSQMLLSILLQMLILAAGILLVAGPFQEAPEPGRGHTVLVLDRSLGARAAGEDGRAVADAVLDEGRELAMASAATGTVALAWMRGGIRPRVTATGDAAALLEALADPGVPQGARRPDEIAALARDAGEGARVVYVTPFDPGTEEAARLRDAGVAVRGAGRAVPQAGITAVARDGALGLRVTVQGGGGPRRLLGRKAGAILAETPVEPRPGGAEVVLPLPLGSGPRPELVLDPPDAFADDDRADLVLPEREKLRILVVADGATPWIDAFLDALRKSGDVLDEAGSGRVSSGRFRDVVPAYDFVILAGIDTGLPLPPGRYLLLGSRAPDLPLAAGDGPPGPAQPLRIRGEDALVRGLDLGEWRIDRVMPVSAREGLQVVVDGSLGPLVSRGRTGGVTFVHVAVLPEPSSSTLPLLNAFPLLLEAAILDLAGRRGVTGPPVLPAGGVVDLQASEEAVLVTPDGAEIALPPLADATGFRLPERPGVYRIGRGDSARTIALAVLAHPGRPGPPCDSRDAPASFPPAVRRRDHRSLLALVLCAALLLEWLLFQRAVVA